MLNLFDINNTFFSVGSYPVSWIEFVGTIAGIVAVWMAAKNNILTWPIGLINITLFFLIFFQVQLYSDMFLQIYFFSISVYGWLFWKKEFAQDQPIHLLSAKSALILGIVTLVSTLVLGFLVSNIHHYFPELFTKPAAFPYVDSFVAVARIIANTLMAKRILENWIIWIVVNIICVFLYFQKHILFVSFEYLIFLGLAVYGFWHWKQIHFKELSVQK